MVGGAIVEAFVVESISAGVGGRRRIIETAFIFLSFCYLISASLGCSRARRQDLLVGD